MSKKISVIMPSLNVVQYIRQCIESVLNQTLEEFEILCIDAGSTDGTLEVLREYAEKDNRVRIVHSDIKSYGVQINMGIQMASSDYLAIVETDDFIADDMMEKLYTIATSYDLDYVKAEANAIYTYNSVEVREPLILSDTDVSVYGKVVNLQDTPQILLMDYYIWRGIYSRSFLMENQIVCNETEGAAYQDIGFAHLTVLHARRAMYIPEVFYQYRVGRDGSSSKSMNGLEYTYLEYERLIEEYQYEKKLPKGADIFFHTRMAKAFVCEYAHIIRGADYKLNGALQKYYLWFQQYIQKSIYCGKLNNSCFSDAEWKNLLMLLQAQDEYHTILKADDTRAKMREDSILSQIHTETVVIFGCGRIGGRTQTLMQNCGKKIAAFCDNNQALWDTVHNGIQVISPEKASEDYNDCCYIIANKADCRKIKEQLLKLGISLEQIVEYN